MDGTNTRSQICKFYEGQTIFMTGVTGFLGKVILAQLMQNCPTVKKIFVLIRGRQGQTGQARFEKEVLSLELFNDINKKDPSLKEKIFVVEGDISLNKLGLSAENQHMIEEETTVILHGAATTKFQETIKIAIQLNTLGARKMLELAKGCKKLIAHVHVSTAYVNCIHNSGNVEIREKIYPVPVNPYDFLEKLSTMTQDQAEAQTEQLIAPYPNTYSFSKALAEHFLLAEKADVPICIVRPSIVGCSYQYPVPGWVDSMIAANGLFMMLGLGALHTMHGHGQYVSDFIPVDTIAFLILASAWRTAGQYGQTRKPSLPIYHGTTSTKNPVQWNTSKYIIQGYFKRHPSKKTVGPPYAWYIPNDPIHSILHWTLHTLPAGLADAKLYVTGKKTKNLKMAQRLKKAVETLAYFTTHQWFFGTDNVDALIEQMNEEDLKIFPVDVRKIDWEVYFIRYCQGLRRYLLREKDDFEEEALPQIRSKL